MFCRWGTLVLIVWSVLTVPATSPASAQTPEPEAPWYYRCANWTPAAWDNPGARRLLFPVQIPRTEAIVQLRGVYAAKGSSLSGWFEGPGPLVLGLISDLKGNPTLQFVTRAGTRIAFIADATTTRIPVQGGRLASQTIPPGFFSSPEIDAIECIRGNSPLALEDAEGIAAVPARKPLTGVFAGRTPLAPGPGAKPRNLRDIFPGPSAAIPATPPSAAPAPPPGPAKSPEIAPAKPAEREAAIPPAKAGAPAATSVCDVDTQKRLAVQNGLTLTSPQLAGIRNKHPKAAGFEYVSAGGDVIPLNTQVDVADSAGKLVPYETIAAVRRSARDPLWVSIAIGNPLPARAAAGPARTLRIMVVGAAQEVAVSALDLVGAELDRAGGDPIDLEIEWHSVDNSGSIRPAGAFTSLAELVKAAAGKAGERRSDVLDEPQIERLFDDFEKLLTTQTRAVDKVFWIKGAYPIPSSMPRRFEKLITAVSSSKAIAHTPTGPTPKWLVVVTARMPGFSIAYLKEPIYSLAIGEVLEETPSAGAGRRQLIADAGLLATRLRVSASARPAAKPAAAPADPGGPAARLVIDAGELFAQRGYILSPKAATTIQAHLDRVSDLWTGAAINPDVLAQFAGRIGRSSPTLIDILQDAEEKYPRLPKTLPDWARKPIRELAPGEAEAAQAFVAIYASGVNKVVRATLKASAKSAGCALFFVPGRQFGFGDS